MHFVDLTPYEYSAKRSIVHVYNIGWIEDAGQCRIGLTDPQVSFILEYYYTDLIANLTRGHHGCALCGSREPRLVYEDRRIILGAAELWIPSEQGKIFAAPDLVIHYLRDHSYAPPDEFIVAVLRLPGTIAGWNGEAIATELCSG